MGIDQLWILKDTADLIHSAESINRNLIQRPDGFLAAPYFAGLYAVLHKRSPVWEIYFLFPSPVNEQEKIVRNLESEGVDWALVCHSFLDNRTELQFRNTHRIVWEYLLENFETIQVDETRNLGPECELMRRRMNR